ncbi:MAG: hypothetical protein CBD16_02060 [Betaproteobacteria bacterium TMED156]|nr:MAG: hypothetical protein CBD16_02060 [Betaproteobacteria bacterium TMED156]
MKKLIGKLLATMILTFGITTSAMADYTFVIPQKPGGGTSVWAEIVAKQLEPFLGEKIKLQHYPGARDIPGFNKWHNKLRSDDKVVMVSHGGNGVSFLQENVDYNYAEYESIGLMNLNIIAGKLKGADMNKPSFAAGSGMVPEAFAFTMLICGPDKSIDEYTACFKENVTWVKGMSGGERRLAFKRGELNGTRENPAAYKKHVAGNENAELWFHHGILQPDGSHADDPNYPGFQFEILFEKRWGVAPSGDMYDAYKLVKSFRDGLQKALWVNKGNPNTDKLIKALTEMSQDADAMAVIQKKVGDYGWVIGAEGNAHRDTLMTFINNKALQNLVKFNTEALGLASVYKENLGK